MLKIYKIYLKYDLKTCVASWKIPIKKLISQGIKFIFFLFNNLFDFLILHCTVLKFMDIEYITIKKINLYFSNL